MTKPKRKRIINSHRCGVEDELPLVIRRDELIDVYGERYKTVTIRCEVCNKYACALSLKEAIAEWNKAHPRAKKGAKR